MELPFFVWEDKVYKKIYHSQVMCLFIKGNYITIYTTDGGRFTIRKTLSSAMKKLPAKVFVKIHRSWIVSVHYVDNIAKDHLEISYGEVKEILPISKQYYKSVIAQLDVWGEVGK